MKLATFTIILLLAVGCVSNQTFRGPDGRMVNLTKCDGNANSIADCYRRADKVCPGGYEVVDKQESQTAIGTFINGKGSVVPMAKRELMYVCKDTSVTQ